MMTGIGVAAATTGTPERRFRLRLPAASHQWQVVAAVRRSELEAVTIEVGGGELMFAMTTVGDGFFRAYVDHDDAENR